MIKKLVYKLVWKSGILNSLSRDKITILTYHKVLDKLEKNNGMEILTSEFEKQIRYIVKNYNVISFKDFLEGKIKKNSIIITFDDGTIDFKENAYPILKKYNVKPIVFVISGKVGKDGYLDWKDLKEMNIDIGAHTVSHPKLAHIPLEKVEKELIESKKTIENKLGISVNVLAYPHGLRDDINKDVIRIARENYDVAASNMFGLNDFKKMNRHCLKRVNVFWNDFDIFKIKIKGVGR